jgi:hypothetical protein
MERIPEQAASPTVTNNIYVKEHKINAESVIDRALWTILIFLVLAVIVTFFVEDMPGFVLDIRNLAIDGIWIMACCYSIGEVVKRIYRNKGKATEEYKQAKKAALDALDSLSSEELAARNKYCTWYETEAYNTELNRLLEGAGITSEEYAEKYAHRSRRELKKLYRDALTKRQLDNLARIYTLERMEYNPSFFLSASNIQSGLSPSQMYDSDREDRKNSLSSLGTSILSSLCAVALAGDMIFSFSLSVLFAAVVKITITAIFASFKANFGWNLSMHTDMGRFDLKVKETANLKKWYADNKNNCS